MLFERQVQHETASKAPKAALYGTDIRDTRLIQSPNSSHKALVPHSQQL